VSDVERLGASREAAIRRGGGQPKAPAWIPRIFYAGAVVNWVVTAGSILDPMKAAGLFGIEAPNYPFMARAWAGMAFLFGFMFVEIARDPFRKRAMIRYAWLEKLVSASSVTIGFVSGDAPLVLFLVICLADWAFIPFFIRAGRALRDQARHGQDHDLRSNRQAGSEWT
jgi:hypothetical protein